MARYRGEITVFLSLILSVVLIAGLGLVEAARGINIKARIAGDCNNGMLSALAEYNLPALEKYNIFVLDAAYGGQAFDGVKITSRMKKYLAGANGDAGPMLGYGIVNLNAGDYEFATDDCGEKLYDQAVNYMKKYYGLDIAGELSGIDELLKDYKDNESYKSKEKTISPEISKQKIPLFEAIDKLRKDLKINMVLDETKISKESIELDSLLSHRQSKLLQDESMTSKSLTDKFLYNKYLLKTFSNYSRESKNNYEIEYIIAGKGSDKENLAEVMDKYLLMREVINLAYIHTDAKKKGEASLAATTLLAATGNPALIKAGEEAILAAWAYTESICEARSLLAGKKVPALKTAACWHTKMTDILHPGSSGYLDSASGLSYEDYLLAILMMENDADKNIRFMDLIERSIRKEKGYENFKMENCITGFSLQGSFVAHKLFASIGDKKLSYEGDISYEKLERN